MTYTAQVWDGEMLVREVRGLDVVQADRIASEAPERGYTGRRMPETGRDVPFWRCWFPEGREVSGHFAETVRVIVPAYPVPRGAGIVGG